MAPTRGFGLSSGAMPTLPSPYVELHAHSGYSFLDGASHPEELVQRAVELGYPALALTDHDGLYGSMEFARAAKEAGIHAVTGVELTVHGCGLPGEPPGEASGEAGAEASGAGSRRLPPGLPPGPGPAASTRPDEPPGRFHLTLLAETPAGYANLCRLVTDAHRLPPGHGHDSPHRGNPGLPLDLLLGSEDGRLPPRTEGLILLTGCRRSPLLHALADAAATGEAFARRLLAAFGPDHLFVELQDNRIRGDAPRNRALGRLADRLRIPVVATGNVHYHHPRLAHLQDVLVAIRHRATLDASHRVRRPNGCFHLAPPAEMAARFASREDAVSSTLRIAERCRAFDLTADLGYTFPDFEGSERGSAMQVLSEITWAALEARYPVDGPGVDGPGESHARARARRTEAERRLREELRLVDRHGLGGFFLVYRDIMELARQVAVRVRGGAPRALAGLPPGRGRGSSVSSIICHLIGLSHVDPVEANLFLGRFLNDAMGSVPDIDLDFPREIREALILEVYEKYGHDHTGLVAIFPTYRLRSAVREVGRAMELPAGDLEKLSKLAEHRSATGLREDLAKLPEFAAKVETRPWQLFLERVEDIAGLPRNISQHVGGMIISSRPLVEIVPIEPAAMEGRFLCQWDKDSCDDARFIKIDFLALGMLSLVEEAVDLIAARHGQVPDLSRIDLEDAEVYDRICEGDTIGMFQVESRAQIQMIRRTRPRTLKELAVQVAIVRPGPIVGGAVNPYVRRREALRADPDYRIPYDHPLLEEALEETLGVILYQDQVLQVCRDLAGFTDGQAESLRRAMSRKRSGDAMRSHWEAFLAGATARGVSAETSAEVFRQVVGFSQFGFPKSHAAAFGLLAYQSAWLRHYFPVEYTVALFNNQPMGFYSLDVLGRDARRHGVEILPPDLNRSGVECTVDAEGAGLRPALRVGLGFVRGWGEAIATRVVQERERGGPYRSLVDFLRRTPAALRRPAIENLVWVGGLDGLGLTRRELLWQAGLWLGPDAERTRAEGRADDPQFALSLPDPDADHPFAALGDRDRIVADYRMLRFSTGEHPLALVRSRLPPDVVTGSDLPGLPDRRNVAVAGVVVARQKPGTAKGYLFVLIEDEFAHINVIVKPRVYENYRAVWRMEPFLLVRGRLQKDGASLNVIATSVEELRVPNASHPPLPETQEYWPDPKPPRDDPFAYLAALRQAPPDTKNWG
ncbi:MAG: DNA polymerase III subunit alpha [Gemmatimonadales bacterium]|nr:MAG: DNA polymerase III subunit alpha [Gemmatimonadales bacterium]